MVTKGVGTWGKRVELFIDPSAPDRLRPNRFLRESSRLDVYSHWPSWATYRAHGLFRELSRKSEENSKKIFCALAEIMKTIRRIEITDSVTNLPTVINRRMFRSHAPYRGGHECSTEGQSDQLVAEHLVIDSLGQCEWNQKNMPAIIFGCISS